MDTTWFDARKLQTRSRYNWVSLSCRTSRFRHSNTPHSGQVVTGSQNVADLEKVLADTPMLQQKMKPRHLTMIAVGEWQSPQSGLASS